MNPTNKLVRCLLPLIGGTIGGYVLEFSISVQKGVAPFAVIVALLPFILAALTGVAKNTTV